MEHGQPHAWVDFNPISKLAFNSRKTPKNLGSGVAASHPAAAVVPNFADILAFACNLIAAGHIATALVPADADAPTPAICALSCNYSCCYWGQCFTCNIEIAYCIVSFGLFLKERTVLTS